MYIIGIATAETLIDCIQRGHCDEITPDVVPWVDNVRNETIGNCTGTCCVEIQKVKKFNFYILDVVMFF